MNALKNKKASRDLKSTVIVIDTTSYRGSDEELKQTGVMDFVQNKKKNGDFIVKSKQQEILYEIVEYLFDSSDGNTDLILYIQSEGRICDDTSKMVNQYFENFILNADKNYFEARDRLRILVGNQSLWYYLGYRSPQINEIIWFSKEKAFFSRNFYNLMNELKMDTKIKTYSQSSIRSVTQIKLIFPFIIYYQ